MRSSIFLFAIDAADEQDVRPLVVELVGDEPVRCGVEVREVGHDGQHRRPRKAERLEILPVELGVAERQIAPIGVRPQLAPAAEALARQRAGARRRNTPAA